MDLTKACVVTSGTLLKASLAVVCGKIVAMALGPVEFATFGQYLLVVTMLQGVACLGLANAHVVFFAKNAAGDSGRMSRHAAYSLALVGGVGVGVATVAVMSFAVAVFPHMPLFPFWLYAVLFAYCALTPMVVARSAELNASGQLVGQQLLTISTPIVQVCALLLFIYYKGLKPAEAAIAYSIGFIVVGFPLAITKLSRGKPQTAALSATWQHYRNFILPGVSVPLMASMTTIIALNVVKANVPAVDAGVWFAIWRLSEAYHGIITMIGATMFLPQLARAGPDTGAIAAKLLVVMILLYMPWAIALLNWPDQLMSLAFSREFTTNLPSLFGQVVGDLLKIVCSACVLIFIAISRPQAVVSAELVFGLMFILLLSLGIQGQGLARCLDLYAASYAVLTSVMVLAVLSLLRRSGS